MTVYLSKHFLSITPRVAKALIEFSPTRTDYEGPYGIGIHDGNVVATDGTCLLQFTDATRGSEYESGHQYPTDAELEACNGRVWPMLYVQQVMRHRTQENRTRVDLRYEKFHPDHRLPHVAALWRSVEYGISSTKPIMIAPAMLGRMQAVSLACSPDGSGRKRADPPGIALVSAHTDERTPLVFACGYNNPQASHEAKMLIMRTSHAMPDLG